MLCADRVSTLVYAGRKINSRKLNKGHGLENIHYLNDGLYQLAEDMS
jgi:predicted ribosome-associated RNA-binding protein Tma20